MVKPIDRERLRALLSRYREAATARRALVVEDDPDTRAWLCRRLREEGWTVAEAENGRVALARLAEAPADLVLLDLMMPEMDGFEFLDELRRTEAGRRDAGHRRDGRRPERQRPPDGSTAACCGSCRKGATAATSFCPSCTSSSRPTGPERAA